MHARSCGVAAAALQTLQTYPRPAHGLRGRADAAPAIRRQLNDTARPPGSQIILASRWYPSSKTCSCCGVIKQTLALSQRTFACDDCGFEAGRDHNAALNLARLAASSAVTACGEARSGVARKSRVKRASVKQEENTALPEAA